MEEKKKKFIVPEASIIEFASDDINTSSGEGHVDWDKDDNTEDFGGGSAQ